MACGSPPTVQGWYADLFFNTTQASEFDPTIADVHTQPTEAGGGPAGKVLHNISMQNSNDPGLQGALVHYEPLTFGGDPGTMYEVTVCVRGLVESKVYNNGMEVDNSGTQVPANGLYVGGSPDNYTNGYGIYRLRTESPSQNYYLNFQALRHLGAAT